MLLTTLALALLVGLASVAEAGRTSRPTGKGALHDDSVYCQNWPGGPSRPAYPGTGPQTPCGPNFERGQEPPAPPEEEQEPEEEAGVSCPDRAAALDRSWLIPTAAAATRTHGLWVGTHDGQVTEPRQIGLQDLTGRRKEILNAMICNPHRIFEFAEVNDLQWNIEMRVKIIALMDALRTGHTTCQFASDNTIKVPSTWQAYPESKGTMKGKLREWPARGMVYFAARARASVTSAHAAVQAFRTERSSLDCMMGMELMILDAAAATLGATNFDNWHKARVWPDDPDRPAQKHVLAGLGVPLYRIDPDTDPYTVTDNSARTSVGDHLVIVRYHVVGGNRGETSLDRASDPLAGVISSDDMVPGDYAYLSNLPDYQSRAPSGHWAGENAFFVGRNDAGEPLFFGFGLTRDFLTENQLKDALAVAYFLVPWRPSWPAFRGDIQWTLLGAPTLYGDKAQAGEFGRR